jgi:hypothetical protein
LKDATNYGTKCTRLNRSPRTRKRNWCTLTFLSGETIQRKTQVVGIQLTMSLSVTLTPAFPTTNKSSRIHSTREAIAAGITRYHHINGEKNPLDILSRHWDMPSVWDSLKHLLFW